MILSGAAAIDSCKVEINELNVFPVPDGDTGTNMSLTMGAGRTALTDQIPGTIGRAADITAGALLRGARGNSGVILSLLFRGIARHLKDMDTANAVDFACAVSSGVDSAYKAVMKPTEGTILTVSRLAANAAFAEAEHESDIELVLEHALKVGYEALDNTINLNPVLKKAGVVDAGGKGYLYILEGMLKALRGAASAETGAAPAPAAQAAPVSVIRDKADFTEFETEDILFTYCTEFIVGRQNDKSVDLLRDFLGSRGDSVVVVDDDELIKVHVHSNEPGVILTEALTFGSLLSVKVENMREQHTAKLVEDGTPAPASDGHLPAAPAAVPVHESVTVPDVESVVEPVTEVIPGAVSDTIPGAVKEPPAAETVKADGLDSSNVQQRILEPETSPAEEPAETEPFRKYSFDKFSFDTEPTVQYDGETAAMSPSTLPTETLPTAHVPETDYASAFADRATASPGPEEIAPVDTAPPAETTPVDDGLKPFGVVAVCAGEGMATVFRDLGADQIIFGGQTMNPSTEDILIKIDATPAETVFVLPNNKNIIMAAQQCMRLTEKKVIVIPSKTMPQGISALISLDAGATVAENIKLMTRAIERVHTAQITYAARDSNFDGQTIRAGDYLALMEDTLVATGRDSGSLVDAIAFTLAQYAPEFITVFYGEDVDETTAGEVLKRLNAAIPEAETSIVNGGQPVYYFLISAE